MKNMSFRRFIPTLADGGNGGYWENRGYEWYAGI
jgi:hypothetical protein